MRDKKRGNKETRVGPQVAKEIAEMFCATIVQQIKSGAERQWTDPIVLQMTEGVQ